MVKTPLLMLLSAAVVALALPSASLWAGNRECATVDESAAVLNELASIPLHCIPPALIQDAQGVAIIPNLIKAGFVVGGRHGRGVLVVRNPDGSWSNPVFVSLTGGSIGWQIGVQSTDLVLVFRTQNGLDRIFKGKGKLTLGADASVAAGPVGRQAEAGTDALLRAEILSYSRSRGLFIGLSLEGAALLIDHGANEAFYQVRCAQPRDILTMNGVPVPPVAEKLKAELARLSGAPVAVPVYGAPPFAPGTPPPPPVVTPVPVPVPPPPLPPPPPR